jgi:hypothetical protein
MHFRRAFAACDHTKMPPATSMRWPLIQRPLAVMRTIA